jgi:23S rRNA (cytidine1920-2'-O)/16S rRNA (cytidine1409-2'-O)-methyltransferase
VRRGLAPSRERAQAEIVAGRVLVAGATADKAARLVAADEPIRLMGPGPRYVSRGGEKLAAGLQRFGIDVTGCRALDAGASTGGFVDCLLQHGAVEVVAVDVGRGQLHERLRGDPRVTVLEGTHVRDLTVELVRGPVGVLTADLSFISLRSVIPALLGVCAPSADLALLVKPQFEAGRAEASRGRGVIRDPAVWRRVLEEVTSALTGHGTAIMGAMVSPLRGADGNAEFLVHARAPGAEAVDAPVDLDAVVAEAGG